MYVVSLVIPVVRKIKWCVMYSIITIIKNCFLKVKKDPNVNIHFGATDVYTKNEPHNTSVYNIAITDPTPTAKALSYCSARSDLDEDFDEEEFKETFG